MAKKWIFQSNEVSTLRLPTTSSLLVKVGAFHFLDSQDISGKKCNHLTKKIPQQNTHNSVNVKVFELFEARFTTLMKDLKGRV